MAFVNEKVSQGEKELFAKRNIIDPLDYMNKSRLIPSYWTIDREREAFIFHIGVQRDWPDEEVFFYQLKQRYMFISVKRKYEANNTVVYSLNNTCYSPLDEMKDRVLVTEMKETLKLALDQFKTQGTPDDWNMSTRVICEF